MPGTFNTTNRIPLNTKSHNDLLPNTIFFSIKEWMLPPNEKLKADVSSQRKPHILKSLACFLLCNLPPFSLLLRLAEL